MVRHLADVGTSTGDVCRTAVETYEDEELNHGPAARIMLQLFVTVTRAVKTWRHILNYFKFMLETCKE